MNITPTRRQFATRCAPGMVAAIVMGLLSHTLAPMAAAGVPDEPIDIGTRPQLFVDDTLVDNRYALRGANKDNVLRRFHLPEKIGGGPVLTDPGGLPVNPALRYDPEAGLFRMWYVMNLAVPLEEQTRKGDYWRHRHVRYAESKDGLLWTRPALGLIDFQGDRNNNISFIRPGLFESRQNGAGISSMRFLHEDDLPAADRRGYKYLMTYTLRGSGREEEDQPQVYLIGSRDGLQWDRDHQQSLYTGHISDGWHGMAYDRLLEKYVAWCRPRHRYENGQTRPPESGDFSPGDEQLNARIYGGVVRRLGRMERKQLWLQEEAKPQTLLLPDGEDQERGITAVDQVTVRCHSGVYFGFLVPFLPKEEKWTELVFGRDGKSFEKTNQPLIPPGAEGDWDSREASAIPDWVEVGDEWWIPYSGSNRPPNTPFQKDTVAGIGLAKIRKEGFVSLATPSGGGVVVTRLLRWPGGGLRVNCASAESEMRVRITTASREAVPGFEYADCVPFTGDSVAHRVEWKERSLDELKGQEIRLEFYFSKNADLYSFRAETSVLP